MDTDERDVLYLFVIINVCVYSEQIRHRHIHTNGNVKYFWRYIALVWAPLKFPERVYLLRVCVYSYTEDSPRPHSSRQGRRAVDEKLEKSGDHGRTRK